jgi:hypothetical protein
MSTQKSNQVGRIEADNAGGFGANNPRDAFGRIHPFLGEFNTTDDIDATLAEDDELLLQFIPAGTTLYLGRASFEAMGVGATLDLGLKAVDGSGYLDKDLTVADDPNFFTQSGAVDVSAAGSQDFVTEPGVFAYQTEKELYLTAELSGAIWAADKDLAAAVFGVDRT